MAFIQKYRNTTIANLRSRVQPVLAPKRYDRAYIMLGHGSELTEKRVVPAGCMLVVEAQSGETNYLNYDLSDFFTLGDKLLDPISNYNEILRKTEYYVKGVSFKKKSLAIYREGDEYPDYKYELITKWNADARGKATNEEYPAKYKLQNSGIIEYPPLTDQPIEYIDTMIDADADGTDTFLNLYNGTIYPNMYEIEDIIDTMPSRTIDNIVNNEDIISKTIIRQSQLFEHLRPGIYYNFICRATDNVNYILKANDNENENLRFKRLNHERYNKLGVAKMPLEFKRAVGEAEAHRKRYIKNSYAKATTGGRRKTKKRL